MPQCFLNVSSLHSLLRGSSYAASGLAFMTGFTAVIVLLLGIAVVLRGRSRSGIFFLLIAVVFIWRSFYRMRIEKEG